MQFPHPWRRFRRLSEWELRWEDLPEGLLGITDWRTHVTALTKGMLQAERRSTIAHEIEHIIWGPYGHRGQVEVRVRKTAARWLLPDIRAIGEALAWASCRAEAADELWVDEATLSDRLTWLHPAERAYLVQRLADEGVA